VNSADPDQMAQMFLLIWIYTGSACDKMCVLVSSKVLRNMCLFDSSQLSVNRLPTVSSLVVSVL
jgi:hypothetical protein